MIELKLFQRGLLIAIVPLTLHILLVGWLFEEWWHLTSQVSRVHRLRDRASLLNGACWETVQGTFQAYMNSETLGLVDPKTTSKEQGKFKKRIEQIADLDWSEDERPYVRRLQATTQKLLRGLDWVREQQNQGLERWNKAQPRSYDLLYFESQNYIDCVQRLGSLLDETLSKAPLDQAAIQEKINAALFYAVPASFSLSVILGLYYSLGIRKPIMRIAENGRRLSKREALLPALSGQDELSKLDRLLHIVDSSVDEALRVEKSMLENAANLICSLDEDYQFTRVNPYSTKVLGVTSEELVNRALLDLVIVDERLKAEDALKKSKEKESGSEFDLRLQKNDGTVLDTRWSVFWSETQRSFFCVVQDVSEEKQAEQMKQDFLDMVSHDLRSPLMSMLGSLTLVEEGAKGPVSDSIKNDVNRARCNIERLIELVNDLLDLQKLQSGKMEFNKVEFDIHEIILQAKTLLEGNAAIKNIRLEISDQHFRLIADKQKIMQTFLNFLSNAIKFSPESSLIVVRVQADRNRETLEVSVSDSGPGVPEEYRERIFEPFEQIPGKKSKEGTGLGLAICKLIIEGHGGALGIRSADGDVGSTFWFALPYKGI